MDVSISTTVTGKYRIEKYNSNFETVEEHIIKNKKEAYNKFSELMRSC